MKSEENPINIKLMKQLYNSVDNKTLFFEKTGLTKSALFYVLQEKSLPNAKTIAVFADFFGIPCGQLFNDYEKYHSKGLNIKKYSKSITLKDAVLFYNE